MWYHLFNYNSTEMPMLLSITMKLLFTIPLYNVFLQVLFIFSGP